MRLSVVVGFSSKRKGFYDVLGIGYFTYFVQRKFNIKKLWKGLKEDLIFEKTKMGLKKQPFNSVSPFLLLKLNRTSSESLIKMYFCQKLQVLWAAFHLCCLPLMISLCQLCSYIHC